MSLNFGQELFPRSAPDFLANFDFTSIITGNSYLTLYGGFTNVSDQIYESYTDTPDTSGTEISTNDNWSAQTFTVGNTGTDEDFYFTRLHYINDESQTGNQVTFSIQETTAGVPNGTKLIEWKNGVNARIIAQDGTNYTRVLERQTATNITKSILRSGTVYALVFEDQSVVGTQIRKDSTGSYTGGSYYESVDAGVNWTIQSGEDIWFKVYGSTTNPYTLLSKTFTTLKATTLIDNESSSPTALTNIGILDFSSRVNFSGIIKGLAIIEGTVSETIDEAELVLELLVQRNGSETSIGTATTINNPTTITALIDITKFNLKRGDDLVLRFTINQFSDDTFGNFTINHDPLGTQLILNLPFKTEQ